MTKDIKQEFQHQDLMNENFSEDFIIRDSLYKKIKFEKNENSLF